MLESTGNHEHDGTLSRQVTHTMCKTPGRQDRARKLLGLICAVAFLYSIPALVCAPRATSRL